MEKTIFIESHNIKNRETGLGTFNYELIKGLSELNFDNFKIILNTVNQKLLQEEFGEKFDYHKYNSLSRHWAFRTRKKHDLWHSVNQNTKIEPFRYNNYLLTVHDVNFIEEVSANMNHKVNKLFRKKLEKSTAITYISEFAKQQTHSYFNVPNVPEYVIHNGNPISKILNTDLYKANVPTNKPFFYCIGDFIERKNYGSIINMMQLMTNFNLIISGNHNKKYGEEIKDLIIKKGLQNQVFLTGKVTEQGKQFFMKNCTAFLFPSIREGFGLPPIEAMSFGKPVFLSNKTSLPEIGGDSSYYWTDFDPEYMQIILTDGLNHFYNNQQENEVLVKRRASGFDWKIAAAQYFDIYQKILI